MSPPDSTELLALRDRAIVYLEHLMNLLRAREQPFLLMPFPDDPTGLPPCFPDGDCAHRTYINAGTNNDFRQEFEVKLRHFDPAQDDPFLTWEMLISKSFSQRALSM